MVGTDIIGYNVERKQTAYLGESYFWNHDFKTDIC